MVRRAAILVALLSVVPLARADVTGKVTLVGTPPDMGTIDMSGQKQCAALHPDPVTDQTVIVGDNGELRNVVVSLKKADDQEVAGQPAPPKDPAVLDQKGCLFEPHVLAMQAGQTLVIKNSDPFLHNVDCKPTVNDAINMAMPTANAGEKADPQPKAPETFKVKCDVHPWMTGWIAIFDHPYFAVTGDDGTFTIKGLPDGTYTLQAWHERYGTKEQQVTVKDGKATVNFSFKTDDKAVATKK
jgi:plastocyanin